MRTQLALCLALLIAACDGGSSTPSTPSTSTPPAKPALETVAPPASGPVALTAAGVKIDPPAALDQLPDGAWYCDMGTAHFGATEKNDGKCPLCGMDLQHKGAH